MWKLSIYLITASLFMAGCGKTTVLVSLPKKGTVNVVNVGESIYTYYYGKFNRRARLLNNRENMKYQISSAGVRFDPLDGHKCALHIGDSSLFDYNCDGVITHNREGIKLSTPLKYRVFPHRDTKMQLVLNQVMLYQGRVGNKIKVSHREFAHTIARPSFTQDIEYQLQKNGRAIIGFKGVKIKVLRATNTEIKYQVIEGYN